MNWNRTTRRSAGALLAMTVLVVGAASHWTAAQSAAIRLVIDYGDGVIKTMTGLPWSKGSTVLDVMNAAKARPHGMTFSYSGSGGSSVLNQIDDARNEGGGVGQKNWQLWVNTTYADRSFGVYEVQAFDVVYWRFTTQEGK
jgi:carbohydrate-selective porin OprB